MSVFREARTMSKQCMFIEGNLENRSKKKKKNCHVAVPNSIAEGFQIKEANYLTGFPKASC